jgi:ABC-type sugar transport system permease subunit
MLKNLAVPPAVLGRTTQRHKRPKTVWPYLFSAPMVVVLLFVFGYPIVGVLRNSVYSNSFTNPTFVGGQNFMALYRDESFRASVFNSMKLLITVPVTTALALLIALMLYEGTRGWKKYRLVLFVPYMIPVTAVGMSFSYLLQQNGIVNQILRSVGLGRFAADWLGNPSLVIYSIGGVIIWTQLGFGVVVFTAALLSLPKEVNEAALVDGAGRWQRNRLVVVPQLRGTIQFFVVLEGIQVLAWAFPYVYVLTRGGPGTASTVMDLYVWQYGFNYGSPGMSAAAAVVLLGVASILIVIYARVRGRQE